MMATVPTGRMESELRKQYLKWVKALPQDDFNVESYLQDYIAQSVATIEKMGGRISRLGVSADFPAPKLLDLSMWPTRIYTDLEVASIRAGIATGLNARQTARAMMQAGAQQAYWKLERLARTETVQAYWRNQRAEAADLGLVLLWSSETGPRTCDWCLERDGMVADDGCRDHPNGRCTLLPTLPSKVKYKGSVSADGSIYWDDNWDKAYQPAKESLRVTDIPTPVSAQQAPMTLKEMQEKFKRERRARKNSNKTVDSSGISPEEAKYRDLAKDVVDTPDSLFEEYSGLIGFENQDILADYFGNTQAWEINAALRSGKIPEVANEISDVISDYWLPNNTRSFRVLFDMDDLPSDLTGHKWTDRAFQSTTTDESHLQTMAQALDREGSPSLVLDIVIPKDTPVALYGLEHEILLNKNSTIQIVSDTTKGNVRTLKGYVIK